MGIDARAAIEAVFREEFGRIAAALIRTCGSFEAAEEAAQEAFAAALPVWLERGIPDQPGAWILTAARRKLIDSARRQATRTRYAADAARFLNSGARDDEEQPDLTWPDDRLRLLFTCCHPALGVDSQVALTLRTLGGLTTEEIARAFLVPEATLAQRLVRAKRKIQAARIPYEVPPIDCLPERLTVVRAVLYLIFNEGYSAATGPALVREDLCREAIRLAGILRALVPDDCENLGLESLMRLHFARRRARVSASGELVTLEEQDRSLWDHAEIQLGCDLLERALQHKAAGPYQLQAAIAALHAQAATARETDWAQIAALYGELEQRQPGPVVRLNRAAAVAMAHGPEAGLQMMESLEQALDGFYLFHAARADLFRRMERGDEAAAAYRRALELVSNPVERDYLTRRYLALRR